MTIMMFRRSWRSYIPGSVRNYIRNINPILDDHCLAINIINLRRRSYRSYYSWLSGYYSCGLSYHYRLSGNNGRLCYYYLGWPGNVDECVDSVEDSIEDRDRVVSIHLPEHCYCHS
jgi:hypothetical protein